MVPFAVSRCRRVVHGGVGPALGGLQQKGIAEVRALAALIAKPSTREFQVVIEERATALVLHGHARRAVGTGLKLLKDASDLRPGGRASAAPQVRLSLDFMASTALLFWSGQHQASNSAHEIGWTLHTRLVLPSQ